MEPISTLLMTAAGYILKSAAESKVAGAAKEEVLGRFWKWIKPRIIKEVPEIEEKPDAPETESKTQERLLELVQDESFFKELEQKVTELKQAGIKEKNIFRKDIERVKKIKIGDKELSPNESYDKKNIVEGNVRDADEFILGDGH